MRSRFIIRLILILIVATSQTVLAEPTPTIRYLMNEPVSMLDWGLYRLGESLWHYFRDDTVLQPKAFVLPPSYDWDHNKIVIRISPMYLPGAKGLKSKKEAKDWCAEVIRRIRFQLSVDPKTGKPIAEGVSGVGSYFTHKGWVPKNEPKKLREELDRLVEITIRVASPPKWGYLKCNAPLLGTDILFAESSEFIP